ncbi:MAG TPA: sigma-70 family RNA polymerase sigma factor [Solirubrobacteraceae bacterium]|jgi:RNA polymerase sigma factor (sigma-70 family)|nr:sigma-70 family RNA polymerase sigma factor [Solirubrobacteraceae bacterium]
MSPLSLRRHRAERLLQQEFEGLRGRVLASVQGRLRGVGVSLDRGDLEACYAEAWQGLYAAVLDGQEIASPTGWLVLVTFRRAIEEQRARTRTRCAAELRHDGSPALRAGAVSELETPAVAEHDLAAELDDRVRLRQLFEGLRGRLDGREREAATLCYLQGLSRSEAAARMGVSEARMRKLMEGAGPGRPGVAGKVGALVHAIRDGDWCEEQGSLMRALAFGVLDPGGERYQLALMHRDQCSACRAYVVSLRGLAAALPPVFLPWGLGAAALARVAESAHAGGAAAAGGATAGGAAGGGAAGSGAAGGATGGGAVGSGSLAATGAVGAAGAGGAAGGGWLIGAGGLGAKLAVGCLLALGVGAGCVALEGVHPAREHRHALNHASRGDGVGAPVAAADQPGYLAAGLGPSASSSASRNHGAGAAEALTPSSRASREFGPEQALGSAATASTTGGTAAEQSAIARSASSQPRSASDASGSAGAEARAGEGAAGGGEAPAPAPSAGRTSSGDSTAAEKEFSPG